MVDFRKMVAPAGLKRLRDEAAEMRRLHGLKDELLARRVLYLARQVRAIRADKVEPPYFTYTTALLHTVIPFLAVKLDPSIVLEPDELDAIASTRSDKLNDMASKEPAELRRYVGAMVDHASLDYGLNREQAGAPSIRLMSRMLEHGNPVALLVDRLCPAPAGLERVERRQGETRFPAWIPTTPCEPLAGFWLMATRTDGHEAVVAYLDSRDEADGALARAAYNGLPEHHHLFSRWSSDGLEPGAIIRFDLRNQDDEVVSEVLEARLKREDAEADGVALEP